jgi:hypothetical protein
MPSRKLALYLLLTVIVHKVEQAFPTHWSSGFRKRIHTPNISGPVHAAHTTHLPCLPPCRHTSTHIHQHVHSIHAVFPTFKQPPLNPHAPPPPTHTNTQAHPTTHLATPYDDWLSLPPACPKQHKRQTTVLQRGLVGGRGAAVAV